MSSCIQDVPVAVAKFKFFFIFLHSILLLSRCFCATIYDEIKVFNKTSNKVKVTSRESQLCAKVGEAVNLRCISRAIFTIRAIMESLAYWQSYLANLSY